MESDNQNPVMENSDQEVAAPAADWRSGLDVTVKEHPSLKNFKTPGDLARSWVEAQKLIGKEKLPVPGDKATQADWDLVFDRLGRPKDKEGYTLPEVKYPEGFPKPDDKFIDQFKSKAHELGLLPKQVEALYNWYSSEQVNEYNQFNQQRGDARGEAENFLRKKWGKAFEQNYSVAEQAVSKYGSETLINKLKQTGLNNDPDVIMFIADMAKNFSEDKIAGKAPGLTLSPDEATHEIAKIKGDPKHPYWNKMHPEHSFAMQKMQSLFEMAHQG
jgi:hypothetical protein